MSPWWESAYRHSRRRNWHAFYGGEESDDRQVAGDICSRFFDIHGAMVETNMSEKTLSIEMNKLKQARYSIGIAMSEEKYSGIVGALRGKYINCLVTNEQLGTITEIKIFPMFTVIKITAGP